MDGLMQIGRIGTDALKGLDSEVVAPGLAVLPPMRGQVLGRKVGVALVLVVVVLLALACYH